MTVAATMNKILVKHKVLVDCDGTWFCWRVVDSVAFDVSWGTTLRLSRMIDYVDDHFDKNVTSR